MDRVTQERADEPVCTICRSPVEFIESEGVWRHKGPNEKYFAQTFCDKYGYPVKPTSLLLLIKEHLEELADAWQRGCISEHDGKGGTRSNRNMDLLVGVQRALQAETAHRG